MKDFTIGFIFILVIFSFFGFRHYENSRMRKIISPNGVEMLCQVVKYRFWYSLENCSNGQDKQIGLNEINLYQFDK